MLLPPIRLSNFDDQARLPILIHALLALAASDPQPGSQDPQFAVSEFLADCRIPSTLWPLPLIEEHAPEMDQVQLQASLAAMLSMVGDGRLHGELRLQRGGRVHVMLTAFDGMMLRMEIAPSLLDVMLTIEPGASLRRSLSVLSAILPYALREGGHEEILHAHMSGMTDLIRSRHDLPV